jgi:hypothetical protein
MQVTDRNHHDPGDPTERQLAEALLAAVLVCDADGANRAAGCSSVSGST